MPAWRPTADNQLTPEIRRNDEGQLMPATTSTAPNRYAPPRAAVRDYVASHAEDEPAGRGTRLAAAFLDGVIVAAMVYLPLLPPPASAGSRRVRPTMAAARVRWRSSVPCWHSSVCRLGLADDQVRHEQWPIDREEAPRHQGRAQPTAHRSSLGRLFWLRNVVNGVAQHHPALRADRLLFIFGESRQCLHDKIADTIVVKA